MTPGNPVGRCVCMAGTEAQLGTRGDQGKVAWDLPALDSLPG